MKDSSTDNWSPNPPTEEGWWWLFGDEEFGTMGGNYSGTFPPEEALQVVKVEMLGDSLVGICRGRIIDLVPFDAEKRIIGYVGVWQKIILPELPKK
jgi:hypothetical protein